MCAREDKVKEFFQVQEFEDPAILELILDQVYVSNDDD